LVEKSRTKVSALAVEVRRKDIVIFISEWTKNTANFIGPDKNSNIGIGEKVCKAKRCLCSEKNKMLPKSRK
jgi:hypothetical protein